MKKNYLYGMMGFLSLLGFIGIFSENKAFLAFFAFAVDFQYFFLKTDEMLEEYLNKSASRAFYIGMFAIPVFFFGSFFGAQQEAETALLHGLVWGWVVSIIVYALSTVYYSFRENWRLERD